jgi:hypothetical protein
MDPRPAHFGAPRCCWELFKAYEFLGRSKKVADETIPKKFELPEFTHSTEFLLQLPRFFPQLPELHPTLGEDFKIWVWINTY